MRTVALEATVFLFQAYRSQCLTSVWLLFECASFILSNKVGKLVSVVEGLLQGHGRFGQVGRCRLELGLEVFNRFFEALVVLAQLL